MLVRLEGYGATLQQAVLAAVLVRLLTVWLTAALGVAGCWRLWRLDRRRAVSGAWTPAGSATEAGPGHFDALGAAYAGELSPAARERVVGRKVALTVRALRAAGIGPGARLLDAGCGPGWYVAALAGAGYRVVGVDLAPGQVAAAREAVGTGPGLLAASVLALPFQNGAFDAALAVNVLHHAGDRADQDAGPGRDGPHRPPRGARPGARDLHRQSPLPPLHGLPLPALEAHRPGHGGLARPPPASHRRERRPGHPAPLHLPARLHPRGPLPLPGPPGAVAGALPLGTVRRPLHRRLPAPARHRRRARRRRGSWPPVCAHHKGRSREPRRAPPSSLVGSPSSAGPPWPWRSGPAPWPSTASTSRGSGSTASVR